MKPLKAKQRALKIIAEDRNPPVPKLTDEAKKALLDAELAARIARANHLIELEREEVKVQTDIDNARLEVVCLVLVTAATMLFFILLGAWWLK